MAYAFSFRLTNPWQAQASPSVSISVGSTVGGKGAVFAPIALHADVLTIPNDVAAVAGDAAPLYVRNGFVIRNIGHSSPFPGVLNTITVTVACNSILSEAAQPGLDASAAGSRITITGLTGSATADTASMPAKSPVPGTTSLIGGLPGKTGVGDDGVVKDVTVRVVPTSG
jgi:hypothetical protein